MDKNKALSMDIKNLIIDQHKNVKSLRFNNNLLNLKHSAVEYVVKKCKMSGPVQNAVRTGRPNTLSSQEMENILNEVK